VSASQQPRPPQLPFNKVWVRENRSIRILWAEHWADRSAGTDQDVPQTRLEIDLDVAADHLELAYRLRQEERAALREPAAPCHIPGGDPATRVRTLPELHAAAADAHRAAGNGDLEHLHGAVAKEQLRRVAQPGQGCKDPKIFN